MGSPPAGEITYHQRRINKSARIKSEEVLQTNQSIWTPEANWSALIEVAQSPSVAIVSFKVPRARRLMYQARIHAADVTTADM